MEPPCKSLSTFPSRAGRLETKSPSLQCHGSPLRHVRLDGQATRYDMQLCVHEAGWICPADQRVGDRDTQTRTQAVWKWEPADTGDWGPVAQLGSMKQE